MKRSRLSRSKRAKRGGALVMISVLVVGLASLSVAMIALTNGSRMENRVSKQELAAQAVAEAGINLSYRSLASGGNGSIGSQQTPVAYDGADYWVTQANGLNQTVTLRSTAQTQDAESTVEMTVQLVANPLFQWAAFGDDALHMDSNAFTDSYVSNAGSYASQVSGSGANAYADDGGDVGSNGSILMEQNSKVFGDAVPGPANVATVLGNAQLAGSSTPAPDTVDMPPITLPAVASSGALVVPIGGTQTIGPGTVHYSQLLAQKNSTLNVVGPATIICDTFQLRSNTQMLIDATNGKVELYVVNDFLLNSNAIMRSNDYKPKNLEIKLLSDNVIDPDIDVDLNPDDLTFDSNSKIYGTIYAPNAKVEIDSNFELFGSVVAREIDLDSNSKVHFDETLLTEGPMGTPEYQRVAWRVID
ncbi:MAG: hypothetical protein L6Q99_13865 [Planctomycetes bacterium]|nr:hypothetical protein [Planctomycetota bacterium]